MEHEYLPLEAAIEEAAAAHYARRIRRARKCAASLRAKGDFDSACAQDRWADTLELDSITPTNR